MAEVKKKCEKLKSLKMGKRPIGVRKAKRIEENNRREDEVANDLRLMRQSEQESNKISKKVLITCPRKTLSALRS